MFKILSYCWFTVAVVMFVTMIGTTWLSILHGLAMQGIMG